MSITIRKFFFAWSEDKEQLFLEDMARKGYKLTSVGFGKYTFEESEPEDLVYQFDFKGMDNNDVEEYIQLYEDSGWTHITTMGGWFYYARPREDNIDLSLFNDNSSRKEKYKKLLIFLAITGFPLYYNMFIFIPMVLTNDTPMSSFLSGIRIVGSLLAIVHAYALVRILIIYHRYGQEIKE